MAERDSPKRKPLPGRMEIIKILPRKIKESLTLEEISAILYEEVWPDSLQEKLKDYLED